MKLQSQAERAWARWKQTRRTRSVAAFLSVIVVFVTLSYLILPAITLEWNRPEADGIAAPASEEFAEKITEETLPEEETLLNEETLLEETEEELLTELVFATREEAEAAGWPEARRVDRLICGQTESEEHRHTAECFETYYVAQSGMLAEESFLAMPAQSFEAETEGLRVHVDAPEGAFPEGSGMTLGAADTDAVREAVLNLTQGAVGEVVAAEISFEMEGERVKPELPVRVTLESEAILRMERPVIVHIDDEGNAEIVEQLQPEEESAEEERESAEEPETPVLLMQSAPKRLNAAELPEEAPDGGEPEEQTPAAGTLVFEAQDFSVYAIVDAPEPVSPEIQKVTSLDELTDGTAFLLSYDNLKHYFINTLNNNSCFTETGVSADASEWYFEAAGSGAGTFKIYTYINGEKKYVKNTSGNLVGLADTSDTVFELSDAGNGTFYFKKQGENKWLQHSNGGGGIRFYTDKNNATNTRISITYASSYRPEDDPYALDGKTFGIAYNNESATAAALTPGAFSGGDSLAAQKMLIRPDILDNEGVLLVASDSDITEWTFRSVSEDGYYITTTVDGEERYLKIDQGKVALTDDQAQASVITASPGTGSNSGKWHFTVDGYSLNYNSANNGSRFNSASGSEATTWMNLVEKSQELTDEDFVSYTARKVSVSDTESVPDGAQVILYTRIWNDKTKRYEFYAVDHNGSLIRCYESGDVIEWVGGSINTAVWDFTDYQNGGVSSYYYELQNVYSGKYLVPQLEGGQVLSDSPVGINLNGRRYGDDYTTIIAWDDPYYEYAGIRTEDGHIVSCPLAKAEDFYFAIVQPPKEEHALTEVPTIDSDVYGISMKMIDYSNTSGTNPNWRDKDQSAFFKGDNNTAGLLSTNLGEDGYPTSTQDKTGHVQSLSGLYSGAEHVNYLFLASKYNESGYFEYDSTQNAAHLNDDGTFTVYDQLFAVNTSDGPTRTHGQFMPYNEIDTSVIAPYTNQTDVLGNPLPDTDPRKGEEMFWADGPDANYFFGMEMEAGFTQTASGLDAWGHDIIFEFSGDDDFWFYVDGELVLDLGGVHSAMTGSINFRTGEVKSSRGNSTLYEIFKKNYKARGLSDSEINAKLDEIFTTNSSGQHVFKDYTNHTMKMFYMERGAGASNLHMRFNLAAVKPGTVVLSKSISGTDKPDYTLAEFPYQIYYTTKDDGGSREYLLEEKTGDHYNVTYEGKSTPVKFRGEYTPAGGAHEYNNVFFLKPGQSAEIQLPENVIDYRIVECGINPSIYDRVTANDAELTGTDADGDGRTDYSVTPAAPTDRRKVDYDNHVNPDALRTLKITKKLYDADSTTLLSREDDPTEFSFRLFLGMENDDDPVLANMHEYHVMNEQGFYCRWDNPSQSFVSLGVSDWNSVADADKADATFTTSPNGSISKIPAGYSIVVHELVVGSKFKVEEREYELPEGYTLREEDGYTRVEGSYLTEEGESANAGIIRDNSSPEIEVRNQRGWGLTARKIWSDADYMESHSAIQMAVFIENDDGSLTMVPGSLKTLEPGQDTLYWYYDALEEGKKFSQYVIREVVAEGSEITIIGQGEQLTVNGIQQGESEAKDYTYSASYTKGQITGSTANVQNIRTDTVTNARSGIIIQKTMWDEETPLAGAAFALKDAEGNTVGQDKYISDAEGLVTVAYLANGTYTLTETGTPNGYLGIPGDLTITVAGSEIQINGAENVMELCKLKLPEGTGGDEDDSDMPEIIIRNRQMKLKAIKTGENQVLLSGVHFALYRQVIGGDGNPRKDYSPLTGYEDLETGADGVIPKITEELAAGTYYLTETQAAEGYEKLTEDLCFTIGTDGNVTVNSAGHEAWLTKVSDDAAGTTVYTLAIPNGKAVDISLLKKWYGTAVTPPVQAQLYSYYDGQSLPHTLVGTYRLSAGSQPAWQMDLKGLPAQVLGADSQLHDLRYYVVETGIFNGEAENAAVLPLTAFQGLEHRTMAVEKGGTLPDDTLLYGYNLMQTPTSDADVFLSESGTLVVGNRFTPGPFETQKTWYELNETYEWTSADPDLTITGELHRTTAYTDGTGEQSKDETLGTVTFAKGSVTGNTTGLSITPEGWKLTFPEMAAGGVVEVGETYYPADFSYAFRETAIQDASGQDVTAEWEPAFADWQGHTDLYNYRKSDLTIEKIWTGSAKGCAALYFTVKDGEGNFVGPTEEITLSGTAVHAVKLLPAGAWTGNEQIVISGLPVALRNPDGTMTDRTYTVTEVAYQDTDGQIHPIGSLCTPTYETKVRNGTYASVSGPTAVTLGKAGETHVRITNTLAYDVNILKTNGSGQPLAGAQFQLYDSDPGATPKPEPVQADLVSGPDGLIALGKLTEGTYYLVETQAPSGYIGLTSPVVITVNPASTQTKDIGGKSYPLYVTYSGAGSLSEGNAGISVKEKSEDGLTVYSYTLTVPNSAGVSLPSTGGRGTAVFTAAGSLLCALALLLGRRKTRG